MSAIVFNQGQLCEALRVSRPTITKYVGHGMPILSRGKYDLGACITWFVEHKKSQLEIDEEKPKTSSNPEIRLLEARAFKLEMENDERTHELIPWEQFAAFILWYSGMVADGFEALGARLGTQLAAMDEPSEIQHMIHTEGRRLRDALSHKLEKVDLEKILPKEEIEPDS